jgi:uncharacterized protein (TIGR04255 family)
MPKKYNKPPIIEAVCEFRFSGGSKWDLTIPGLIYDLVKDEFPQKEPLREFVVDTGAKPARGQFVDKVRFKTEEGKQFIQVAPLQISVHRLAPYQDWESFLPMVEKAFEAYKKVGEPTSLSRIGVRYINAFDIPGEDITLDEYFEFYPNVPVKLEGHAFDTFISGLMFHMGEERDILKVELQSAATTAPNTCRVLLDLDYYLNKPEAVPLDEALEWVGKAHDEIESTFEACMKNKVRALLQPVKE